MQASVVRRVAEEAERCERQTKQRVRRQAEQARKAAEKAESGTRRQGPTMHSAPPFPFPSRLSLDVKGGAAEHQADHGSGLRQAAARELRRVASEQKAMQLKTR